MLMPSVSCTVRPLVQALSQLCDDGQLCSTVHTEVGE